MSLSLCWRALAVGLLLAGPLLLPQGHWLAIGLLAVVGVVRWQAGRAEGSGKRQDAPLLLMLLTLAAALVVSGLWHGGLSRVWPVVLMALCCILALRGLHALRPRITWLWGGLVLAGVGSGVTGAWLRWEEGHGRVRGLWEVNAILYGNIALLAGLLCLAGLCWAWRRPRRTLWLSFLAAGALGGLLASAVSGSRGGWLALPLAAGVFAAAVPRRAWRLRHAGIVALLVLLLAGLYAWPGTGVQRRVGLALKEVAAYRAGESTGSVGARLEMYRGAAWLIAERPLPGVGPTGYRPAMQALVAQGRLPEGSERFWHAHHDLLDAWVRHGLLGLIAVLLAYAVPLWRFLPGLRAPDPTRRALCVAGTLLPICYLAFGMSYTLLAYPLGVAVYGGWLALLWVQLAVLDAAAPRPPPLYASSLKQAK
ncbi:O-antigen ligase family protein [Halomonas sp. JS92-SW72]|uniref:O-antigen ligase family protein n=1 Tax=Halomonas sp. JS92-SW72 TaxID=2306583 RepID=UPI0013C2A707|nr:O-antigen ligase family protein [Halomonas sp. JS92-SW72]